MPPAARPAHKKTPAKGPTIDEHLQALPADRRALISAVRDAVNRHLPKGYTESVSLGMITWHVPLATFPGTYNGQPLCYIGLAAQKHHNALYLMGAYADPAQVERLQEGFKARGKKLDMGKSCLRFKSIDDLPLDVIGQVVKSMPPRRLIELHEASHRKP